MVDNRLIDKFLHRVSQIKGGFGKFFQTSVERVVPAALSWALANGTLKVDRLAHWRQCVGDRLVTFLGR